MCIHIQYTTMSLHVLLALLLSSVAVTKCDNTITVYPETIKMGDVTHFDHDRWNGKNGLDSPASIPYVRQAGATAARWLNRDLAGGLFEKATENPHKKGYPDPAYFLSNQHSMTSKYLDNVHGYGNAEMVMEIKGFMMTDDALNYSQQDNSIINIPRESGKRIVWKLVRQTQLMMKHVAFEDIEGLNWPHWIDTTIHNGHLPNNIDAAAEFVYLLIEGVDKGTNGKLPLFLEVINEPDAQWKNTNWTTFVTFHQAVAQKLKSKYPHLRVGGPTYTGASASYDRYDFRTWKRMAQFMDMALTHLDFFSFHSYTPMDIRGGTHQFRANSEAKLFGLLDLIESYAHKKTGKSFNVIVSEFGLGGVSGIDVNKPSTFLDWAYIYQHNAQLFTFLERRDIVRKVVAFLLTYTELKGQESINYSILDKNHNERDIAQAFKFWKNIHNTMTYLRIDSHFNGAERKIVPHALVDKSTGALIILLHNHDKKTAHVKLNFDKGWFHPTNGKSTCEYLNPQKKPILEVDKPVHVANSAVTVPAEASCYFQFHTTHNFAHATTVTQTTYYSSNMVIPIHGVVDVKVNIPTLGKIEFVRLRIGISLTEKSANPKPKTVQMNNHHLTSFYSLHTQNGPSDYTVWQSYVYNVPVNNLQQHNNDVKLTFNQNGGYVSTVAVIVGRH